MPRQSQGLLHAKFAAEAATFDKPATVFQRFKKDFAGRFEDQL